jgi:hypothetical protein
MSNRTLKINNRRRIYWRFLLLISMWDILVLNENILNEMNLKDFCNRIDRLIPWKNKENYFMF